MFRKIVLMSTAVLILSSQAVQAETALKWEWESPQSMTHENLNAIAYGKGKFVIAADDGKMLVSRDAVEWSLVKGIGTQVSTVFFLNNTFYAISGGPDIYRSDDGFEWTYIPTNAHVSFLDEMAYGEGTFVGVRVGDEMTSMMGEDKTYYSGSIKSSPDGVSWTYRNSYTNEPIHAVAYGGGVFVVVGRNGTVLTSTDGISWTMRNSGISDTLVGISYLNGFFLAFTDEAGSVLVSKDGVEWKRISSDHEAHLVDVVYGNGIYVAVGKNGAVLKAEPIDFEEQDETRR